MISMNQFLSCGFVPYIFERCKPVFNTPPRWQQYEQIVDVKPITLTHVLNLHHIWVSLHVVVLNLQHIWVFLHVANTPDCDGPSLPGWFVTAHPQDQLSSILLFLHMQVCVDQPDFFFFWWGLLHGPQQGPDRMKGKKPIRLGKGKLLPKQKNPPW
jgi:hypothetical protein